MSIIWNQIEDIASHRRELAPPDQPLTEPDHLADGAKGIIRDAIFRCQLCPAPPNRRCILDCTLIRAIEERKDGVVVTPARREEF